jgi:hypothetical protein
MMNLSYAQISALSASEAAWGDGLICARNLISVEARQNR